MEERRVAVNGLAFGVGILLLAAFAALIFEVQRRPDRSIPKVVVGTKDEIYYSHAATRQDAIGLGQALRTIGFFADRGSAALLSKNPGGTIVSFVLPNGLWNRAPAVASFEEIGRRIAGVVGGLPIEIRLVDSAWSVKKTMQVGKIRVGSKDEIYYLGSATAADAQALGRALREAGYMEDLGVSVSISKDDGTAIGFVVGEGVWRQPDVVAGFQRLARRVAPSVGGLPLEVRILSPQMEVQSTTQVR
jgi:hypothetical protein